MVAKMKEIHAYQNDDGTYRVEILGTTYQTKMMGKHTVKETIETKTKIPRASIQIDAYTNEDIYEIFTFEVE